LKTPRTTTGCTKEVQQVSVLEGGRRGHRSLTQETLEVPRVSTYDLPGGESLHVCLVDEGETWMTPYKRYLADGLLPLEPAEARVVKKKCRKVYSKPIKICQSSPPFHDFWQQKILVICYYMYIPCAICKSPLFNKFFLKLNSECMINIPKL